MREGNSLTGDFATHLMGWVASVLLTIVIISSTASAMQVGRQSGQRAENSPKSDATIQSTEAVFRGYCKDCRESILEQNVHDINQFRPWEEYEKSDAPGVGVIKCEGWVNPKTGKKQTTVATGWIPGVNGRVRDVVVTSAHTFLYEVEDENGRTEVKSKQPCYFLPQGESPRIRLRDFAFRNNSPKSNKEDPDIAAAVLDRPASNEIGALGWAVMEEDSFTRYRDHGVVHHDLFGYSVKPFSVGYNADRKRLMTSRNCGLRKKEDGDFRFDDDAAFHTDCNLNPGQSGGFVGAELPEGIYAFCVNQGDYNSHTHEFGNDFDGSRNPNVCEKIDDKTVAMFSQLARDEWK